MRNYYERYWQKKLPKDIVFFDGHPTWSKEKIRQHEDWVNKWLPDNVKILDYGCGEGDFTAHINAIGTDISYTAVEKAKSKHPGVFFFQPEQLKGDKFGGVLLFDVLEHIFDFEELFGWLNQHTEPGARLLITTNENCASKMFLIGAFLLHEFFHYASPHIRFFTKRTLKKMLEDYGYKVIHYERVGNYFGLISKGQVVVAERIK